VADCPPARLDCTMSTSTPAVLHGRRIGVLGGEPVLDGDDYSADLGVQHGGRRSPPGDVAEERAARRECSRCPVCRRHHWDVKMPNGRLPSIVRKCHSGPALARDGEAHRVGRVGDWGYCTRVPRSARYGTARAQLHALIGGLRRRQTSPFHSSIEPLRPALRPRAKERPAELSFHRGSQLMSGSPVTSVALPRVPGWVHHIHTGKGRATP